MCAFRAIIHQKEKFYDCLKKRTKMTAAGGITRVTGMTEMTRKTLVSGMTGMTRKAGMT